MKKLCLDESQTIWRRAEKLIPSGTQTLSKAPGQFVEGVYPKYLVRGQGAYVWDADDNRYIDYPLALGAILLGHAYPAVTEAVTRQIKKGSLYTLMHPLEVEVAELLVDMVPCAEMVRFGKNGSDATTAAIRVARSYTGREHVAFCGYHGWQDWYACTTSRDAGLPKGLKQFMHPFAWNDLSGLAEVFDQRPGQVAAVILEVPAAPPQDDFLENVKELTQRNGAVLIFDEIATGFRFARGGVQELYGVRPDLACLGKAMANGFPLSAVVGAKDLMKELDKVFFSMTFGGETASLAAAKATLLELRSQPVVEHIWRLGRRWRRGFEEIRRAVDAPVSLEGHPPRSVFAFEAVQGYDPATLRALFLQETIRRGILFGLPIYVSYSHTPADIDRTLAACEAGLRALKEAIEQDQVLNRLQGRPPESVFRPTADKGPRP